ncbi:MAG: 23S rRNA (uracil(1939)-C(5))-methyltransferase RlmD [Bacteroidota bacterium]
MAGRKHPVYEAVTVEDLAAEGKAICRIDQMVVFVKGAVPGDVVDLQIGRKRKRFAEARILRFRAYSPDRQEPVCRHFGICGGCKWQQLPYPLQLRAKEKQVVDTLRHLSKVSIPEPDPIMGSQSSEYYRNKLEYTFSSRRWLTSEEISSGDSFSEMPGAGFHVQGRYDRVVDLVHCHLQEEPTNLIRNLSRSFALENGMEFYDFTSFTGLMRNLIIRNSTTGELMVIYSFREERPEIFRLMDHILDRVPGITSMMYTINPKKNETLYDLDIICYRGKDHIIEKLGDLNFKIGPKSFFQTNSRQAHAMYEKVKEFAALTGKENVYDLYTGTGSIAIYLARYAAGITGIESVPEAIEDARENAALNGIANTRFLAGDMRDLFTEDFIAGYGRPDVVITDPPRAGMHPDVVKRLLDAAPGRIVYVSCNPATQARDLELLAEKYRVTRIQPVDMFPHTHHVENIALLEIITS